MRYFFRADIPECSRILLIESGSRSLIEGVIPALRNIFGEEIGIDLVTCYPGAPQGVTGRVIRVTDYGGAAGRSRLWAELSQSEYGIAGIVCSAEPIMTKWKWWLGSKLKAKLFILNENGDFFWLDRTQWRTIVHFAAFRTGLTGAAAVPSLVRFALFPLTLAYLILYACTVHLRRKIRTL
ncbi:MAG TPA: hypothetical protein VFW83_03890 [Bryobacteraceae bacterium]|nr:hypothetical protein [Bryobacteraceae bacterium]